MGTLPRPAPKTVMSKSFSVRELRDGLKMLGIGTFGGNHSVFIHYNCRNF